MKQFPLDKTFIISLWLEALVYGFFLCLFCASLYVNVTLRRWQDGHSRAMFFTGIAFFLIATMHLAMNCFRMIRGYVDHAASPGGAVGYLGNLAPWDHVFKDTLYATQEILGDGVAIYRCWVIWGRDWRIVVLPIMLFIVSLISGYTVCGLYPTQRPEDTVFDPRLTHWISTFYAVAVVQSTITTGLMAYKIWWTDRRSASYRANASASNLMPVLKILIESASLQLVTETLLLALYAADYNAQYILLEIVTPLVGITFTAITIRLSLRMSGALDSTKSNTTTNGVNGHPITSHAQIATIGSMPMRPIAINITQDVHLRKDGDTDRHASSGLSRGSAYYYNIRSGQHTHRRESMPISIRTTEGGEGLGEVDGEEKLVMEGEEYEDGESGKGLVYTGALEKYPPSEESEDGKRKVSTMEKQQVEEGEGYHAV